MSQKVRAHASPHLPISSFIYVFLHVGSMATGGWTERSSQASGSNLH